MSDQVYQIAIQGVLRDLESGDAEGQLLHLSRLPDIFLQLTQDDKFTDACTLLHHYEIFSKLNHLLDSVEAQKLNLNLLHNFVVFIASTILASERWSSVSLSNPNKVALRKESLNSCLRLTFLIQHQSDCDGPDSFPFSYFTHAVDAISATLNDTELAKLTLENEWFSRLLISESRVVSVFSLSLLQKCIAADSSVISLLEEDILIGILDELSFKISVTDDVLIASVSTDSLFSMFKADTNVRHLVTTRYLGIRALLTRWVGHSFDSTIRELIRSLTTELTKSEKSPESLRRENAAVVIQRNWRGYSQRSRLKKMTMGFVKLQLMFRKKWKRQKEQDENALLEKQKSQAKACHQIKRMRESHEKMLVLVEAVAASGVDALLQQNEEEAAVKIQSRWRGVTARGKVKGMKTELKRDRAATLIQKHVKTWLRTTRIKKAARMVLNLDINEAKRVELQEAVTRRKKCRSEVLKTNPTMKPTRCQLESLDTLVQECLETRAQSSGESERHILRCKAVLASMDIDMDLILAASSLEEIHSRQEEATIKELLNPSSRGPVRALALQEHVQTVKRMRAPWWNHLAESHDHLLETEYEEKESEEYECLQRLEEDTEKRFCDSPYWKHLHWTLDVSK